MSDILRISLQVGDTVAEATLLTNEAPRTSKAIWDALPIVDRTIQTRWSGNAWRTEQNYDLVPRQSPIENPTRRLAVGDIIYYRNYDLDLLKIGVAYADAQWLGPFMYPREVTLVGHIDANRDAFAATCKRIIFDGPMDVKIDRIV